MWKRGVITHIGVPAALMYKYPWSSLYFQQVGMILMVCKAKYSGQNFCPLHSEGMFEIAPIRSHPLQPRILLSTNRSPLLSCQGAEVMLWWAVQQDVVRSKPTALVGGLGGSSWDSPACAYCRPPTNQKCGKWRFFFFCGLLLAMIYFLRFSKQDFAMMVTSWRDPRSICG